MRKLVVFGILTASALLAQTSHRQLDPKPPSRPNPFEQLEKEATESKKDDRAAAREQRKANRAELNRELPQLIELAQKLQERLDTTSLEATLPADLEKHAKELEQAARQIHKRIRGL